MNDRKNAIIEDILNRVVPGEIVSGARLNQLVTSSGRRTTPIGGDDGCLIQRVRECGPGDRPDYVATAKTGWTQILTTIYQTRMRLGIFVIGRKRETMKFGSERVHKDVLAAELIASIIASATASQDDLSYIGVTDRGVDAYLPLRSAANQMLPALEFFLESTESDAGAEPASGDNSGLIDALSMLPRRRCLVFIVDDFLPLTNAETEALGLVSRVHDICCLIVGDKRDRELQNGRGGRGFGGMRTGRSVSRWLNDENRRLWAEEYEVWRQQLKDRLTEAGCATFEFSTEADPMERMAGVLAGHGS